MLFRGVYSSCSFQKLQSCKEVNQNGSSSKENYRVKQLHTQRDFIFILTATMTLGSVSSQCLCFVTVLCMTTRSDFLAVDYSCQLSRWAVSDVLTAGFTRCKITFHACTNVMERVKSRENRQVVFTNENSPNHKPPLHQMLIWLSGVMLDSILMYETEGDSNQSQLCHRDMCNIGYFCPKWSDM